MFFRVRDRKHRPPAPPLPAQALETVRVPELGPGPAPTKESLTELTTVKTGLPY